MKKIALLLILFISGITAFAQDRYAYISDVKHNGSYVEVTVSARPNAFNTFPEGFDVVVSPTKDALHYLLGVFGRKGNSDVPVFLSPREKSVTITYNCNENEQKALACKRDDFNVKTQTYK